MAVCSSCGAENPEGFRFCGSCGTALGTRGCTSCGFVNPAGQHFCGQCGTRLSDEGAPATTPRATSSPGERKLATILFADVVGFTSLSENSDPEAIARTVDAAFRRLAEVVEAHGGTVDKYLGDALMAVFGVPVAHDDDAERAVAAALAMRDLGGDLAFSIGINSGEVMATAVGRDGDVTVIGDAVNVAARLEKAAAGGDVLVGPLTAELAAGGIAFRERQPVLLKGKRDPVAVFQVVGLREVNAAEAVEQPPLVGRDDELAFLRAQWRRVVRDRRAAVVLVAGEAGMGKTRLLEELCADVADEAAVAFTHYPAYGGLGGPQVAADIAEQLGPMGEHEVDVRVKSVAGEVDPSLHDLDPESLRQEQLWAYRRFLKSKAADQPILIVIDDIHRSGEQTLDLLSELMTRIVDVPVLLALAGRPEPGNWLARLPGSTTVRLDPLSPADSEALVSALVPSGAQLNATMQSLVERGTGNPLYLRELVAVVCADGGNAESLPPTLQAILVARLDALPPDQKGAIQRVSVLGDVASEEQVAMLGLSEAGAALRDLVAAGLLRQREDACYEVADPLLREVAYETLPRQVRGEWHRQAAGAVPDAVQRARQLERAADYLPDDERLQAEAATALRHAGVRLLEGFRLNDGFALLLRAVEHGERDAAVLLELASGLANSGRGDEALQTLAHLDDDELSPHDETERDHIVAVVQMFRDPESSWPLFEEAAQRWADLGNGVKEGWAWSNRGVALFNGGRMAEASDNLERAIQLFAAHGEHQGKLAAQSILALIRPDDPRVSDWLEEGLQRAEDLGDRAGQCNSLVFLAWHHMFRSYLGGRTEVGVAEDYADRARRLAQDLGSNDFQVHGLCLGAITRRFTGRLGEAAMLAEEAEGVPVDVTSPVNELVKGVRFLIAVTDDPAVRQPSLSPSNDPVAWVGWLTLVEALLLAGRVDEASTLMARAEELPGLGGAIDGMTRTFAVGFANLLAGRHESAGPFLRQCLASAQAVRAGPMTQVAHALLGEFHARRGEADEAARVLAEAGSPEPDGLAAAFVRRSRALLGVHGAAAELQAAAERLAAPGLMAGLT